MTVDRKWEKGGRRFVVLSLLVDHAGISVWKKLANSLTEIFENFVFVPPKNIDFPLLSLKPFIALEFSETFVYSLAYIL